MTTIAGASQFLNAATLANSQGLAAQAPSILDGSISSTSILDAGRSLVSSNGVGLSSSARSINDAFLNNTTEINALLSLAVGPSATIEGLQGEILALRASLPASAIHRSVFFDADNGSVSSSDLGTEVDEEA